MATTTLKGERERETESKEKKIKLQTGLFLCGYRGQQDYIDSQHLILRTAKV